MTARFFEGAAHAKVYANFRPSTPSLLTKRIISFLQEKHSGPFDIAVDVGCGSGQSTKGLAKHFKSVVGLDISEAQIKEAIKENSFSNISYRVNPAENLPYQNGSVQLVTSGQACHWFDLPKFYEEVSRILVPSGVLALFGHKFPHLIWEDKGEELNNSLINVYRTNESYWRKGPEYLNSGYTHDIFKIPLAETIRDDSFTYEVEVTVQDVVGYLSTWSGYQNYKKVNGDAAANQLLNDFKESVMKTVGKQEPPEKTRLTMSFPFFLLMGRK